MASLCVGGSGSSRLSPSDPQVQRLKRYLQSSNPTRVYKVLVEIRYFYLIFKVNFTSEMTA